MYLSEMQPGPKTVPSRNVSSKELDLLSQIVEKRLGMDLNRRRQERLLQICLLYTSPSPRDRTRSRMPSSA